MMKNGSENNHKALNVQGSEDFQKINKLWTERSIVSTVTR